MLRIDKPKIAQFSAMVETLELRPAKGDARAVLIPEAAAGLPPRLRVTIADADRPAALAKGDSIRLRARLMPPPTAAVPGSYDFRRAAWFQRLGGVGSALGRVERIGNVAPEQGGLRARLSAHVRSRLDGSAGGIAAAFATGDRGGIAIEDEEAMRASGLTHLLSISGLHITAVVAAVIFATMRLLALSPTLALRLPLPLIAAGAGALAGVGYTLLTGAEVPTIRSCIAALLVLAGLALGREAITLRLVAAGALVVLLLWPEALVGASFQLSFAAITAIVAFHESGAAKRLLERREEGRLRRLTRGVAGLLITGIIVEVALAPIALFHFHKSGVYGALANMIAIPLTTFVVMPLEALALVLDAVGLGAPAWWLTGISINALLALAGWVASVPGAMAAIPDVPKAAFAAILGGGLWMTLWQTRLRWAGLLPFAIGIAMALAAPAPDILITDDGRHMVVRDDKGVLALLRPRTGDFMRDVMAERSGSLDPLADLDAAHGALCGRDVCTITLNRGGRRWRVMAIRSGYRLPWPSLVSQCSDADIVVSERRLPRGCLPKWFKADPQTLRQTGGLAITLDAKPIVQTTKRIGDKHPWAVE